MLIGICRNGDRIYLVPASGMVNGTWNDYFIQLNRTRLIIVMKGCFVRKSQLKATCVDRVRWRGCKAVEIISKLHEWDFSGRFLRAHRLDECERLHSDWRNYVWSGKNTEIDGSYMTQETLNADSRRAHASPLCHNKMISKHRSTQDIWLFRQRAIV